MQDKSSPIPQAAAALGYLGALPFVLTSFALWFVEPAQSAQLISLLILAGAVVFGFVGGMQLGMSMLDDQGPSFFQLMVGALVIALAGFMASGSLSPAIALVVLLVSFCVQLWIDLRGREDQHVPGCYSGLRLPLTILVVSSLASAIAHGVVS
jgi:hypothetical protein